MNKERKKGISLILLIIIIIIILILAGAIMFSLSKNNPIEQASKAVFLNDFRNFESELYLYETQQFTYQNGLYDPLLLQSDETSVTYNSVIDKSKTMNDLIPSLGRTIKYAGEFEVVDGKLVFKGSDKNKQNWCKEIGVDIKDITSKISLMNNSSYGSATFVIVGNNALYGWGSNNYGQLGIGTTDYSAHSTPTKIILAENVKPTQIVSGYEHTMAIGDDGGLYTWGNDSYGQLGDGIDFNNQSKPTKITLPNGVKPIQITAGYEHSLALCDDGNLYGWGYNYYGQIGSGQGNSYSPNSKPIKITFPNGVKPIQIAAGYNQSKAICDDGNLYAWGRNYDGELGMGTSDSNPHVTPTKITLPNGVKPKQIACGLYQSLVIGDDDELYTWGANFNGQLGDGTKIDKYIPTKITLASGVKPKQIACGEYHSMAIGSDGNLYTWGDNSYGELGIDKNIYSRTKPAKIILANGIKPIQISCGYIFTLMVGNDGNLYTCGNNSYGELGSSTTDNSIIINNLKNTSSIDNKPITAIGTIDKSYTDGIHKIIINTDGNIYFSSDNGNIFTQIFGFSGTIDKVYSNGCNITIINTDGNIYYSDNGNDFYQLLGFSGTVGTVFSDGASTTIINTNGIFYKSTSGANFKQTSNSIGTIDKIYGDGNNKIITNTIGWIFIARGGEFSRLSGYSGTIDKIYINGFYTTMINTLGDIYYVSGYSNYFNKLSGFSGTISTVDSDGCTTTITNTSGEIYKSSNGSSFTKIN